MPLLKPLTEVARADGKFLVDALAAAGMTVTVGVIQRDPALHAGPTEADVVVDGALADIEALLAGKTKTELNALDKLKLEKRGAAAASSGIAIRGRASSLRALVAGLAPKSMKPAGSAKDIAAEAGAVPSTTKKRDRVRRADGRYIKGLRPGGARSSTMALVPAMKSGTVDARSAPVDRAGFALQNLASFVSMGLERAERSAAETATAVRDDELLVILAGEIRREMPRGVPRG